MLCGVTTRSRTSTRLAALAGALAIDLGGLHPQLSATVDLDASAAELGIAVGNRYAMDIFHAERHTDASNFHVETTIDCFVVE